MSGTIPRVAVIGAAGAKGQEYMMALSEREDVNLVAGLANRTVPLVIPEGVEIVYGANLEALLEKITIDVAVLALPHDQHMPAVRALAAKGIRIIKEKPLALTREELEEYKSITPHIFTTVQRGTHPVYQAARKELASLGEITSFTFRHTLDPNIITSGWRLDPKVAGGGILIDLGYHSIDQIVAFLGKPNAVQTELKYKSEERREAKLENVATLTFDYGTFTGTLHLERSGEKKDEGFTKEETFTICGKEGSLIITPTSYKLLRPDGSALKHVTPQYSKLDVIQRMFDAAFSTEPGLLEEQFDRQIIVMDQIFKAYGK